MLSERYFSVTRVGIYLLNKFGIIKKKIIKNAMLTARCNFNVNIFIA